MLNNNNQNNSGENKRKREEGSNQGVEQNTSTREQKEAQRRFRNLKQNLQTSFQWLKIGFTLNERTIKSAYRRQSLVLHPDKGGEPADFRTLKEHLERIIIQTASFQEKFPGYDSSSARGYGT